MNCSNWRRSFTSLVWWTLFAMVGMSRADWPAFRHDSSRSGKSAEAIDAKRLALAWTHRTGTTPQTAWAGAAKYDAYGHVPNLKSMRNYDPVFHPTVADGRVYFGSSVDHAVHCLSLDTGEAQWVFTTNGPVRSAVTLHDGKAYFGSDDGHAYCLDARSGALVWRYSPKESDALVIHEGNLVSSWPCRTGVLVDGSIAYAAFSLFPWQPSYLVALNPRNGKVEGDGSFRREFTGLTLEGPMLASATQLICPQGRVAPLLFRRTDGNPLGSLPGGGGCMVVLGEDGRIFHGPGNKRGEIYVSNSDSRQHVASFGGATALVADADVSYVLTEGELLSVPGKPGASGWKLPMPGGLELIRAGDLLFVGLRDAVIAVRAVDGKEVWRATVAGRPYGLAAAGGKLIVSTDEGNFYCFAANGDTPPDAIAKTPPIGNSEAGAKPAPPPTGFTPSVGPYLRFTGPERAIVRWNTDAPMASELILNDGEQSRRYSSSEPTVEHAVTLDGLRKDVLYQYQLVGVVDGNQKVSTPFECDTFFNHEVGEPTGRLSTPPPAAAALAGRILNATGVGGGLCFDLGCGNGELAEAIAFGSDLRVIGFDDDAARVEQTRRRLRSRNVYGSKVVVLYVDSLASAPLLKQSADLIVSSRLAAGEDLSIRPGILYATLRPRAAAAFPASPHDAEAAPDFAKGFSGDWPTDLKKPVAPVDGLWVWRKPDAVGTGDWTHQYGAANNSAYGGESLGGVGSTEELRVQWFGRPGPRAQADRSGRKPGPLAAGGRLFAQGLNRITALSAFNGTVLWSLEVPGFERFNVPRDSSNWCADEEYVYAVVRDRCWKIRAADGTVEDFYKVEAGPHNDWSYEWGYVARAGAMLLGSSVKSGTRHTNFWGGGGWYDDKFGAATFKVCSDRLFAIDAATGSSRWSYSKGLILNATITASGDRVYFVESRHPKVIAADNHRVGLPELWLDQYLVALDSRNGGKLWEQPIDTADGNVIFHLAATPEKLVLLSSDYRYNAYAFEATTGKPLWTQQFDWQSDNHGGHMSRPAIVGNKVFIRPRVLNLQTGELLKETMPGGGCGSYAATENSLIFRAGNITMWDMDDCSTTNWHRLRPDCWISTIPAAGMLLSPEGGGGCSCGSWLETSIAFIPDDHPPPRIVAAAARFVDRATVEIERRGDSGVVRYTLDGTDPDARSAIYEKPLVLAGTTVVKARTFVSRPDASDLMRSSVALASLVRDYPPPIVSPQSIPFVKRLPVELKLPGEFGEIRYTTDGSDPSRDSLRYEAPLALDKTTTVKARVIFDDGTPGAIATGKYELIDAEPLAPVAIQNATAGLTCESYEGNWQVLPDFGKLQPKKSVTIETISLEPRTANDAFGLRFRGYVKVPVDGVYAFATRSDDGSRLWIGDQKVVDNDGLHDIREKTGWIALKAGLHPLKVEYWDAVWGQFLEVTYEGPGIPRQNLPASVLFH